MTEINFHPVQWEGAQLVLLDQTQLPLKVEYIRLNTIEETWQAIRNLVVRGANAIGIAAAFGLYLGVRDSTARNAEDFFRDLEKAKNYLGTSRPTAVHMYWAMDRVVRRARLLRASSPALLKSVVLQEAKEIQADDVERCRKIGENGLKALQALYKAQSERNAPLGILTHCNAGALGTSLYGTATAPMYLAKEAGMNVRIFADETRPVLQGARLTAWELQQAGLDVTLICDNMAAIVMREGLVQVVFVGADRIAANGDTANKIGTYGVAVLAKAHGIPFYVAAPTSVIDMNIEAGDGIVIEERPAEEVTEGLGKRIAPEGIRVYNPAFDVTPGSLITGIITEKGVLSHPYVENIQRTMAAGV